MKSSTARCKVMPPLELKGPISEPLPCWKIAFVSERAATEAPSARPMRAYHCPICRAWHRTERITKR